MTNPLGLANEFSYNTEGRMSSEKDHRGKSTAHTYDPFGRETSVTFPDNTTATVSYGWSDERLFAPFHNYHKFYPFLENCH